MTSTHMYLS